MTYRPAYAKRYVYDRHRGIDRSLIPANVVIEHVAHLEACGLSRRAIAETAGVSVGAVSSLMLGNRDGMQRAVATLLLAVTPRAVYSRENADGFVPKIGAVRRIQALYAMGWTGDHVNAAAGKPARFAQNIINQPGQWITADTWRSVAATYDDMWDQPGPSTVNRARASRNGWAPPLAWDDGSLDDPHAQPVEAQRPGQRGTGVVNADSLADCAEWGLSIPQAAERLGVSRAAIEHGIPRHAPHLREAFTRNSTADEYRRAS